MMPCDVLSPRSLSRLLHCVIEKREQIEENGEKEKHSDQRREKWTEERVREEREERKKMLWREEKVTISPQYSITRVRTTRELSITENFICRSLRK